MKIPSSVRYFNKKYTNRLMSKIAGKRHSPIVLIRHVGRKSGRQYETPVVAARNMDHFIFALTYGKEVDWYRNILTHTSAEVLWKGYWFRLTAPKSLDTAAGKNSFPLLAKTFLTLLGISDFFQMEIEKSED